MPYATLQDLIDRYPERELRHLTDPQAQQLDTERANQAINDATAEIDGYLAVRYLLPLQDAITNLVLIPACLVRAACDIAVYRLQTLRASDDIKDARQRYEDVIKLLKAIASGDVGLAGIALRADVVKNGGDSVSVGMPEFVPSVSNFGRDVR